MDSSYIEHHGQLLHFTSTINNQASTKTTQYSFNMQFTTIATLLAAAMSASATPLEARQTSSTATGQFYNLNDGCNLGATGTFYVFADDTNGACVNVQTQPAVIPAIFTTNFTQVAITPGRTRKFSLRF